MEKFLIADFDTYAREPVIRRMKDGTLVCLFLTGGPREPHNDNVVMISYSHDDGASWSSPKVLFSHPDRGCWSTELFTETDNPFAIIYTYNTESYYRELQTFRSFCSENGESWSEPTSFPGPVNGCSLRQGIVLSNGDLLFPLYWQEVRERFDWSLPVSPRKQWPFVSGICISQDGGKTFSRHGYFSDELSLWEPNAVEAEDGHIIMYLRASGAGYLYFTESFDYGKTWTRAVCSDIPNADTKVTLFKIGDTIFMINNFVTTGGMSGRTHLALAKSTDGKNFEKIYDLEDPCELWFYPHAYIDKEKETLYVAYENKYRHFLRKYSFSELGI